MAHEKPDPELAHVIEDLMEALDSLVQAAYTLRDYIFDHDIVGRIICEEVADQSIERAKSSIDP